MPFRISIYLYLFNLKSQLKFTISPYVIVFFYDQRCCFQRLILWRLLAQPLPRVRPTGFINRHSADTLLHVLMATKLRGQKCVQAAQKRTAIGDTELRHVWVSHVQMCIFSSQLANICTEGLACPLYPTGCQLSLRKMERWRGENVREGEDTGKKREWWWCEDTSPEAFSLSLLFLICLSDDSKNMATWKKRGRHQRRKKKVQNSTEGKEWEIKLDANRNDTACRVHGAKHNDC